MTFKIIQNTRSNTWRSFNYCIDNILWWRRYDFWRAFFDYFNWRFTDCWCCWLRDNLYSFVTITWIRGRISCILLFFLNRFFIINIINKRFLICNFSIFRSTFPLQYFFLLFWTWDHNQSPDSFFITIDPYLLIWRLNALTIFLRLSLLLIWIPVIKI